MKKRKNRSIQLLDKGMLRVDDLAVPYRLNRSERARYLRLTINRQNEVVLTLPKECSLEHGLRFMKTKSEWLQRHLRKIEAPETLYSFLKRRETLSAGGVEVPVFWEKDSKARIRYSRREGQVRISW